MPRAALAAAIAVMLAAAPGAAASHIETIKSTGSVRVDDFSSSAPGDGCGDRAALSGGFANTFDRRTSKLFVFGLNPIGRDVFFGPSWRGTVANRGSASRGGGRHTTFAYCVTRPPRLRLVEASVRIGPSATATATTWCPRGTEAVSGGFSDRFAGTNGSLVFGFRSIRVGRRGWRASAVNVSGEVASRLTVLATCSPQEPHLAEAARTLEVPEGGTRSTTIRCPPGREAWSAGFESPVGAAGEGAFPYVLRRAGERSWRGAAFAEGPSPSEFTLRVYCG
jgi:hypothetical protein